MTTLIILGGEKPSIPLARIAAGRARKIIAADRGYHSALESGLEPDVLTGDFDSIGSVPENAPFSVVPAPEQDATDFEKALRQIPEDCHELEILGGTGLRSDHFLTNLLIAAGLPEEMSVVFHDDTQSIYRLTPDSSVSLNVQKGSIISLIPFTTCHGISTTGLHWNLRDGSLGPREGFGQSNRADRDDLRVSLKSGTLYLIINHPEGVNRLAGLPEIVQA